LVEIQFDEYGGGRPVRMHSELYRKVLRRAGLSDEYGHYVDVVPAITLAISTVMSTFGLNRSLRGAAVGHLAAYEMTSSIPCRRYGTGLRRLGADDDACDFFDEHITADAAHEQMAQHDLCAALAKDEPALAESILFGAAACLYVEGRFARHVLGAWQDGRSSLGSSWSTARDWAPQASATG
jgi:pyrroloquinoline quinone (PQQ) biosynthesis protein C